MEQRNLAGAASRSGYSDETDIAGVDAVIAITAIVAATCNSGHFGRHIPRTSQSPLLLTVPWQAY